MVRRRISSRDSANRLSVSRITVSFILNLVKANISLETQWRVP
jgi:DNA-binding LacI/PurR family transcriptional regulator